MVLKVLTLAAALAVSPAPAALSQSDEGATCTTTVALKAVIEAEGLPYTEYSGKLAKAIILGVTDKLGPPPTDAYLLADPVIVVKVQDKIKVGFIVEGCYIGAATLDVTTWNEIIQKAGGVGV